MKISCGRMPFWLILHLYLAVAFGGDWACAATETSEEAGPPSAAEVSAPANRREVVKDRITDDSAPTPTGSDAAWGYGSTHLRIGLARPTFSDDLKYYDKIYDKPTNYPTIGFDYYFIKRYVAVGAGLRTAYYSDRGHAVRTSVDNPEPEDLTVDENGPVELTLVPLQAVASIEFSPFPRKYIVIDGYAGFERLFFQDVRVNTGETDAAAGTKASAPATNKGIRQSIVVGGAVNILLNGLDEQSANSMRQSMGLGSIYLSPFFEIIKGAGSKKGIVWDRTNVGIAFTFESIH